MGVACGGGGGWSRTVHSERQDEGAGEMPLDPPGVGGPCTTRCRLPAAAMPSAPLSPTLPAPSSATGRGREAPLLRPPVVVGGGGDCALPSPPAAASPGGPAPPQRRQCAGGAAPSLVGLPFSGNRRMASSYRATSAMQPAELPSRSCAVWHLGQHHTRRRLTLTLTKLQWLQPWVL